MSILDSLTDKDVWLRFFESKTEKHRINKRQSKQLQEFIENEEYLQIAQSLQRGDFCFDYPTKKLINKTSGKKRTVYSYPYAETACLKLISYLLHKYDYCFCDNLYSFRISLSAKNALSKFLTTERINEKYCYKTDISNYFNSIDADILIDRLSKLLQDSKLLWLFSSILKQQSCYYNGQLIEEKMGAMAGVPLSAFFANVYLSQMDEYFLSNKALYARYSDDVIVFADSMQQLLEYKTVITEFLRENGLEVNLKKQGIYNPDEGWDFLGVYYHSGNVDLSMVSLTKIKGKIKRKARSIRRWKIKKNKSDKDALALMINKFDKKFYDNDPDKLNWSRWFFPLLTRADTLNEVDLYMQQYLRYICTGRHSKGNYEICPYSQLKELGYRPLVSEYYKKDGCN